MRVQRGDVFWVDPGESRGTEQAGRRPYLVLSHEVFNERSASAITMALTSRPQRAGLPVAKALDSGNLPKRSWVKIGHVRTISLLRFGRRIGRVDEAEVNRIVEGLFDIVGP